VGIATYRGSIPRYTFKSDDESSQVDFRFEISKLEVLKDLVGVVDFWPLRIRGKLTQLLKMHRNFKQKIRDDIKEWVNEN